MPKANIGTSFRKETAASSIPFRSTGGASTGAFARPRLPQRHFVPSTATPKSTPEIERKIRLWQQSDRIVCSDNIIDSSCNSEMDASNKSNTILTEETTASYNDAMSEDERIHEKNVDIDIIQKLEFDHESNSNLNTFNVQGHDSLNAHNNRVEEKNLCSKEEEDIGCSKTLKHVDDSSDLFDEGGKTLGNNQNPPKESNSVIKSISINNKKGLTNAETSISIGTLTKKNKSNPEMVQVETKYPNSHHDSVQSSSLNIPIDADELSHPHCDGSNNTNYDTYLTSTTTIAHEKDHLDFSSLLDEEAISDSDEDSKKKLQTNDLSHSENDELCLVTLTKENNSTDKVNTIQSNAPLRDEKEILDKNDTMKHKTLTTKAVAAAALTNHNILDKMCTNNVSVIDIGNSDEKIMATSAFELELENKIEPVVDAEVKLDLIEHNREDGIGTPLKKFSGTKDSENLGAMQSPWFNHNDINNSDSCDSDELSGNGSGNENESNSSGMSSITNHSVTTGSLSFNSIQTPSLHHLDYLASKSSSLYVSRSPKRKSEEDEVRDVHSMQNQLTSPPSFQSSKELLKVLFGCKSRKGVVLLAMEQCRCLHEASRELITLLFGYLEKHGDSATNEIKGLALPASAIGWLVSQFPINHDRNNGENIEGGIFNFISLPNDMEDKLVILKELLSRHTKYLRVTGSPWPVPKSKINQPGRPMGSIQALGLGKKGDTIHLTDSNVRSAISFLSYYRLLQIRPRVDMALFPNICSLGLDGVVPESVTNLDVVKDNLSTLKVERGCIYNLSKFLGRIHTPVDCKTKNEHDNFQPRQNQSPDHVDDVGTAEGDHISNDKRVLAPHNLNKVLSFPLLKHIKLSHCCIGELTGLKGNWKWRKRKEKGETQEKSNVNKTETFPPPLSLMKNLLSLDLSHNELLHTSTALAGLVDLPRLASINLSHNYLRSMDGVNLMLGNIKRLDLTRNFLSSVNGLDHLYALESLMLNNNQISRVCDLAGLGNLPELMDLGLEGNPIEQKDSMRLRISVLNIFRESRFVSHDNINSTYRNLMQVLPKIDGVEVTRKELVALKELAFSHSITNEKVDKDENLTRPSSTARAMIDPARLLLDPFRDEYAKENNFSILSASTPTPLVRDRGRRKTVRHIPRRTVKISDGMTKHHSKRKLRRQQVTCLANKDKAPKKHYNSLQKNVTTVDFTLETVIQSIIPNVEEIEEGTVMGAVTQQISNDIDEGLQLPNLEEGETAMEEFTHQAIYVNDEDTPDCLLSNSDQKVFKSEERDGHDASDNSTIPTTCVSDTNISVADYAPLSNQDKQEEFNGMSDIVSLNDTCEDPNQANDRLIQKTASNEKTKEQRNELKGRNDNCINGSRVLLIDQDESEEYSFSASDAYGEDSNKSSELVLKRLDFAKAEKDAVYDGPVQYADLFVANFYELYFRCFIFPSPHENSPHLGQDLESEESLLPRIQLYQTDRDLMMWNLAQNREHSAVDFFKEQCVEKFVAVSREDVLPCGIAATARITPHESPLRGFHGEFVTENGSITSASDCQKLLVCISSSAVYFISDCHRTSTATKSESQGNRSFPSSIRSSSKFSDAFWAHAFCRHPLKYLQRITIGFGFQRLSMHFKLPHLRDEVYMQAQNEEMMSALFSYTYVIFTCNKHRTVELLQSLQSAAKEDAAISGIEMPHDILTIDNDDGVVFDAVGDALSHNNFEGVINHYQIVHQMWMHGERDPVRRAVILTDDQILIFNEKYSGDSISSSLHFESVIGNTGDVVMSIIDTAALVDVLEICAASEDPRLITLVIKAPTRIRRSHKWRLICKDGESAERLVEDVRKATAK